MREYVPINHGTIQQHVHTFLHLKPKHDYKMTPETIQQYVNGLCYREVRDVVYQILQNTRHVSFSYFLNVLGGLLSKCEQNTHAFKRKIVLVTEPSETAKKDYKSNQWLSCIAAPRFVPTDATDLYVFEDKDIKHSIISGTTDFIIIDDASYSGDQLTKNISYLSRLIRTARDELKDELERIEMGINMNTASSPDAFVPPPPPPPMGAYGKMFGGGEIEELEAKRDVYQTILDSTTKVHVIIPFFSTLAHTRIMISIDGFDPSHVEGIVYSGEHMGSIREVIGGDEQFELITELVLAGTDNLKKEDKKHQTTSMDKILMYFDHKLADHVSIPDTLIHGDVILHLLWRRAYELKFNDIIIREEDEEKKNNLISTMTKYTDKLSDLTPLKDADMHGFCGDWNDIKRSPIVPIPACQAYADKGKHGKCPSAFYKKNADDSTIQILVDKTVWDEL